MTLRGRRVGFIGGGAMAEALAGGLRAAGLPADALRVSEPRAERRAELADALGVAVLDDNAALVAASDVVVLAVKPGVVAEACAGLREAGVACERPLWVSIAAGITLDALERGLGAGARVVRAMPNTPALVREGATGFCGNAAASAADLDAAQALFESVGRAWRAPREALLDAVTGLSGSGPAYVFLLLEALIDAGRAAGLPADAAALLAKQTAFGAAKLARESPLDPGALRRQVSSPGGTTLAGLARLEALGFAEALGEAVAAATRRAGELGRGE